MIENYLCLRQIIVNQSVNWKYTLLIYTLLEPRGINWKKQWFYLRWRWRFVCGRSLVWCVVDRSRIYTAIKRKMALSTKQHVINSLRPRQNGRYFQTTFSNVFSWMKMYEFRLILHWSLFLKVQLTKSGHCRHYLKQCWSVLLNELTWRPPSCQCYVNWWNIKHH